MKTLIKNFWNFGIPSFGTFRGVTCTGPELVWRDKYGTLQGIWGVGYDRFTRRFYLDTYSNIPHKGIKLSEIDESMDAMELNAMLLNDQKLESYFCDDFGDDDEF